MPNLDDLLDVDAVALLAARRALAEHNRGKRYASRVLKEPCEALACQAIELTDGMPLEVAVEGLARALRVVEQPLERQALQAAAPLKTFHVRLPPRRRSRRS